MNCKLTYTDINCFLSNLNCHNGKNAYYRAIRAFCNWLFRQGYIKDNPISKIDAPKMTKTILPSLTREQVEYLISQAENIRDKCIISLFADSGIRLNELVNIKANHIDWESQTVTIWGKGGKQRKAPNLSRRSHRMKNSAANKERSHETTGILWLPENVGRIKMSESREMVGNATRVLSPKCCLWDGSPNLVARKV